MEPILGEFAKYGVIALAFGLLLWRTLNDKDRMANEMNADKKDLMAAYKANTVAMTELRNTLDGRPCLRKQEKAA